MILEKETALFNENAIDNGIEEAGTKATNYLSADSTGIMVEAMAGSIETPSTATGQNVFISNTAVNVRDGQTALASFGADGARIGKDNMSRMEIGTNSIAGYNDDSAKFFEINMNAGTSSGTISKNGRVNLPEHLETTLTKIGEAVIDISDVDSGTTATWGASLAASCWQTVSRVASSSGCTVSFMNAVYSCMLAISVSPSDITIGTSSSHTATASYTMSGGATISFRVELVYNASAGTVTMAVYASDSSGSIGFAYGTFYSSVSYQATTTAPAATIGTRDDDTPGAYSTAIGEHLYAAGRNQTVLGRYNVEDTSDTYALIVGKGTSDSARSNALTVDWSGNVRAAGSIAFNPPYLTQEKSYATTGERVSLSSGTTAKNVLSVTAPKSGYVFVTGYVQITANANGNRHAEITVDGEVISQETQAGNASQTSMVSVSAVCPCIQGDVIAIAAWQSSGSTLYAGGKIQALFIG